MPKVPWLPFEVPQGTAPERCRRCGRAAVIPWTLRRDRARRLLRTWVCTACQATEERQEAE